MSPTSQTESVSTTLIEMSHRQSTYSSWLVLQLRGSSEIIPSVMHWWVFVLKMQSWRIHSAITGSRDTLWHVCRSGTSRIGLWFIDGWFYKCGMHKLVWCKNRVLLVLSCPPQGRESHPFDKQDVLGAVRLEGSPASLEFMTRYLLFVWRTSVTVGQNVLSHQLCGITSSMKKSGHCPFVK